MRKERSQTDLATELHRLVSQQADIIIAIYERYGLDVSKITVITRDPADDTMYHVTTNEDDEGLKKALELAAQEPAWQTEPL